MAIHSFIRGPKHKGYPMGYSSEMSLEEFKEFLKKFDTDKDGRISRDELREAVRANGGWFSTWKSNRAVKSADTNSNGFVDEGEFKNLVEFAEKDLGLKIVTVVY